MRRLPALLLSLLLAGSAGLASGQSAGCGRSPAAPFAWSGSNVLWLGTSIPEMGARRQDSYPDRACALLGCHVLNMALAGSHIRWDAERPNEACVGARNAAKGLSATRRELAAKAAAAGPDDGGSAYHPSCLRPLRADDFGYEARINDPWDRTRFDAVVIDHGHNDRVRDPGRRGDTLGTLAPPPLAVSAIRTGAATRVTLPAGHGLRAGDDITLRSPGLARMDWWTGEVQAVEGDTLVLPFDSRAVTGSYAGGGSVVRHDKSRLYDAYNLVIGDILHMNAWHGGPPVLIVLATPPSEWTGGRNDGSIAAVGDAIRQVAAHWGLPLYDMTADLKIGPEQLSTYLPDGTHPATPQARDLIARGFARWAAQTRLQRDPCTGRWSASPATAPAPAGR